MHKWSDHENTICILCYKLYKGYSFNKQIDIIHSLLPEIGRNSIGMKIANIRHLDNPTIGLENCSKQLKREWEKINKFAIAFEKNNH